LLKQHTDYVKPHTLPRRLSLGSDRPMKPPVPTDAVDISSNQSGICCCAYTHGFTCSIM